MKFTVTLKMYSNSWRIKVATTTPKRKTQNGGVETHGQSYYKMLNPNGEKMTSHGMLFACIP